MHIAAGPGGAPGVTLDSPAAEIAQTLGALGARRAVVPIAPFPGEFKQQPGETVEQTVGRIFRRVGADYWKRVADQMNRVGGSLKPLGVKLGYHNHNVEFAPIGDTTGWEILVRGTDPALVDFEVDTGWVASAGLDTVAFLARHRGRVTQMHVKDVAAGVTPNFALATKPAIIGTGTLDWKAILPAAYQAGVRHFYVEQEPPFATARLEATARSHDYLAKLVA